MFRTILVPLDGSPLSEQAIPLAASIARRTHDTLDLVRVHVLYALKQPISGRMPYDPIEEKEWEEGEHVYIDATARYVETVACLPVTSAVAHGDAEEGILQRVEDVGAGLIIMVPRGLGAVSRFFLGSVSDQLIRRACVPVLLMPPREQPPGLIPEPIVQNVIIALDGSELAEKAIEPALELAQAMEASCTLLRAVESRSGTTAEADAYLERVAERVLDRLPRVQTRAIVARHATDAILDEAHRQPDSLIALATHGHGGLGRIVLGSVADRVARRAAGPVLVVRPPLA
jgi:nucleotide-binding universal stress UspA family protein